MFMVLNCFLFPIKNGYNSHYATAKLRFISETAKKKRNYLPTVLNFYIFFIIVSF